MVGETITPNGWEDNCAYVRLDPIDCTMCTFPPTPSHPHPTPPHPGGIQIEDDKDVRASSKIVQSELPPPPVRTVRGADGSRGGGGGGDKKGSNTRRSSLDNLKASFDP